MQHAEKASTALVKEVLALLEIERGRWEEAAKEDDRGGSMVMRGGKNIGS